MRRRDDDDAATTTDGTATDAGPVTSGSRSTTSARQWSAPTAARSRSPVTDPTLTVIDVTRCGWVGGRRRTARPEASRGDVHGRQWPHRRDHRADQIGHPELDPFDSDRLIRPARPGQAPRARRSIERCPTFRRSRASTASKRLGGALGGRRRLPLRPRRRASCVFSIDTPPPTVSGSIHMGTVFGYTQTDALARYQRMAGKAVFYPIGWDDNGLATERRVQNFYGVRCDPSQPFDPAFTPAVPGRRAEGPPGGADLAPNFVALCHELTAVDEAVFEERVPAARAVVRLDAAVRHDRRRQPAGEPGRVRAQPRPRRGLQRRGADGLGRRRPHRRRPGRDRGP